MHQHLPQQLECLRVLHHFRTDICQIRLSMNPFNSNLVRLYEESYDVITKLDMLIGRCDLSYVGQFDCVRVIRVDDEWFQLGITDFLQEKSVDNGLSACVQ